jgi:hypothetical protein
MIHPLQSHASFVLDPLLIKINITSENEKYLVTAIFYHGYVTPQVGSHPLSPLFCTG